MRTLYSHNLFIPKENEDDLRDVPQEVRDRLTILPIARIEEALSHLGIRDELAAGGIVAHADRPAAETA